MEATEEIAPQQALAQQEQLQVLILLEQQQLGQPVGQAELEPELREEPQQE